MMAQTQSQPIFGEYYLDGVRETASGFRINPDSTFEFFFSQGALDRQGKGKYRIDGKKIIFTSDSIPEKDFSLVSSKKQAGSNTVIRIADPNENILQFVLVQVKTPNNIEKGAADRQGYFTYEGKHPDSITLMFELCPEKKSVFKISNKEHNYFEFRFEPWLFDFFLNNFTLEIAGEELAGGHPMAEGNEFRYVKSKE